MRPTSPAPLFALAALLACESGESPRAGPGVARPAPVAPAAPPPAAAAPPAAGKAGGHAMVFRDKIRWHGWEDGLARARVESKPILLLVYADWCPHCRELAPVFAEEEVERLASRFVMVRQNHDDEPAWLTPYNEKFGGYVPRIFFFDPDGKMKEDVKSGHPRYPYFYAAEHPEFLKSSMRRVAGG